jgi:hypothetical protein
MEKIMKTLATTLAISASIAGATLAQEPVWDANTVELESQKLSDGVFVVESMLNKRLNTLLFDLI